jgi:hypothetical protein
MTKFKYVGIVAVSAEGAALCYRTICVEAARLFGRAALRGATVDVSAPCR